jgi:hypothetical protein
VSFLETFPVYLLICCLISFENLKKHGGQLDPDQIKEKLEELEEIYPGLLSSTDDDVKVLENKLAGLKAVEESHQNLLRNLK